MTETLTKTYDADQADFDANRAFWSGQAAAAKAQEEALQRLLKLKGQTLTVVKGRKVPHGTSGVCFYSGEGRYGWRVGFETAAGETVWTDVRNVKAVGRGFNPENAPDFWTVEVRRMLDIDGNVLILVRDQDGIEFVVDADEIP